MNRCSMQFKSYGVAMGYNQMFHAIQELCHSYGTITRWSMHFKSYGVAMGHVKINPIQELWYNNKLFNAIQELWDNDKMFNAIQELQHSYGT